VTAPIVGLIATAAIAAVVLVAVSWTVAALWRGVRGSVAAAAPGSRAPLLAAMRLFPATAALAAAILTGISFFRFEPVGARETVGLLLSALALWGLALAIRRIAGVVLAWRDTRRAVRAWTTQEDRSEPELPLSTVDVPYPVVAVVGILRPRLYIARQVVDSCETSEIEAMIAHETAHIAARDNLTRFLFLCAPVAAINRRTFGEIEAEWIAASEEAADDAARPDRARSLALASALTKVARMANATGSGDPAVAWAGGAKLASAISSGSSVESRVRRLLLASPPQRPGVRPSLFPAAVVGSLATMLLSSDLQRATHELVEYCVRNLP
jgi:hypothetical protein